MTRVLPVLGISVALAVGASAPAQAFTPPIGTDKGSVKSAPPSPDGIIAILIG